MHDFFCYVVLVKVCLRGLNDGRTCLISYTRMIGEFHIAKFLHIKQKHMYSKYDRTQTFLDKKPSESFNVTKKSLSRAYFQNCLVYHTRQMVFITSPN